MRLAAVDHGRKRVGLAVCDALGITVRGLDTVVRTGTADDAVLAVAKAIREAGGVERILVGLPLHDDGRESEMSAEARAFGEALGRALSLPVVLFDETLTSWEAEEELKARGRSIRDAQRSGEVDRAAAVALLRSYLRHLESGGGP